jgi:ABC-type phosphate transport system substrate-binding protein
MRAIHHIAPRLILLLGLAGPATFPGIGSPAADEVAIVVGPEVPIDNLSMAELRRVMLGERQFWGSNLKISLLVRAPGSREREVILKTVYQMSEAQFRQYWIAKVFRAEAASGPRVVYSNETVAELTASVPGAMAFLDAAQIPKGLKVLKINGRLPGQTGYPLH